MSLAGYFLRRREEKLREAFAKGHYRKLRRLLAKGVRCPDLLRQAAARDAVALALLLQHGARLDNAVPPGQPVPALDAAHLEALAAYHRNNPGELQLEPLLEAASCRPGDAAGRISALLV